MSYQDIKKIQIVPMVIRDFALSFAKSANFSIDVFQENRAIGLDIFIHNRGASSLTVEIDKRDAITILAGDTFSWTNIKFALVKVASTVAYDLVVAGVLRK